jgi:tRNA-uridine 2-sulfurtransferase
MKIIVAMSGGVDSAVAARMLKNEGHDVTGVAMQFQQPENDAGFLDRAKHAAEAAGVPLEFEPSWEAYEREVVEPFCEEYLRGRTPNPCARCNPRLKFAILARLRDEYGADSYATGHYARVVWDSPRNRYALRRAMDHRKDQSYSLFGLTQEQLAAAIFPLGNVTAEYVREMARGFGYRPERHGESPDFGFVGESHYTEFMRERLGGNPAPGRVIDIEGHVLGRHRGVNYFTIGQRHGMEIAASAPMYVVRLEAGTNTVVVGPREATFRSLFHVRELNWVALTGPADPFDADVKIRATHPAALATVEPETADFARVTFRTPQQGIAPGQAAVFYRGDIVLGGGTIDSVER